MSSVSLEVGGAVSDPGALCGYVRGDRAGIVRRKPLASFRGTSEPGWRASAGGGAVVLSRWGLGGASIRTG